MIGFVFLTDHPGCSVENKSDGIRQEAVASLFEPKWRNLHLSLLNLIFWIAAHQFSLLRSLWILILSYSVITEHTKLCFSYKSDIKPTTSKSYAGLIAVRAASALFMAHLHVRGGWWTGWSHCRGSYSQDDQPPKTEQWPWKTGSISYVGFRCFPLELMDFTARCQQILFLHELILAPGFWLGIA